MEGIRFNLERTLNSIGLTRNKLSVESKTRQATILDLAAGETKSIKLETLVSILDTLNGVAQQRGIPKTFTINDVIEYVPAAER